MAYKAKYDAWAGYSETVYHSKILQGLSRACAARADLPTAIDRFIDARRPRHRLARRSRIALVMGAQRAAALRLHDRLGLGAGARVAPAWRRSACSACPTRCGTGEHVRVDVLYAVFSRAQQAPRRPRHRRCSAWRSRVIVIWLSHPLRHAVVGIGEGSANPGGIPHRYIVKVADPDRLRAAASCNLSPKRSKPIDACAERA